MVKRNLTDHQTNIQTLFIYSTLQMNLSKPRTVFVGRELNYQLICKNKFGLTFTSDWTMWNNTT